MRGRSSLRRMPGGTFQYGLNSTYRISPMKTGVSLRMAFPTTTGIASVARLPPGPSAKAQSRNDGMLMAISAPPPNSGSQRSRSSDSTIWSMRSVMDV